MALAVFILSAWSLLIIGTLRAFAIGKSADRTCARCGYDPLLHHNLTGRCALDRNCTGFKENA